MTGRNNGQSPGPALERLGAYGALTVERATKFALRQHADEVTVEHLLAAMLEDEECAASRIALHAFADPESIAVEVVALSPGIMVVGSERCVPFSPLGVRALEDARGEAAERDHAEITPTHLFAAAWALLTDDVAHSFADAGFGGPPPAAAPAGESRVTREGSPLRFLSSATRRALASAARATQSFGRRSISPVHLLVGTLDTDDELRAATALSSGRIRMVVGNRDDDATAIPERPLAPSQALAALLEEVPEGSGTGEFLAWMLASGSDELLALLARHKVTPALVARARGAFADPSPPPR